MEWLDGPEMISKVEELQEELLPCSKLLIKVVAAEILTKNFGGQVDKRERQNNRRRCERQIRIGR